MRASDHKSDVVTDILTQLDRPVVLIGLMGCGKTRIGRMLADALGLPFADSDDEIEKAAGMSVAEIFDSFGESYFRDGEKRVIQRLLSEGVKIIATGGGAIMTPETEEAVKTQSISIWVRAPLPVMLERTGRTDRRPLLRQGDPAEILKNLMEKRYPTYAKADITIESHDGPVESVLNQALTALRDYLYRP